MSEMIRLKSSVYTSNLIYLYKKNRHSISIHRRMSYSVNLTEIFW